MTRKTIKNPKSEIRNPKFAAERRGSAIILAIVLTTLLAMLGILFLLSSRVDSVATSAVGDNESLKLAVDSVVAKISQVLASNVPGDPCVPQEYYDYPDPCSNIDSWLACLEPYNSGAGYRWRHVTDLYNAFWSSPASRDIPANIIPEYQPSVASGNFADADGDGVSDSIWVVIPDVNSSKGKPIYAAVRIIDNGGMLNINTGDIFNPAASVGSSQSDINLMALSWRPNNPLFPYNPAAENVLLLARNPSGLANYENNVTWQHGLPNGAYTPFDISDELELRYRFLVNQEDIDTRAEVLPWWELRTTSNLRRPADSGELDKWFINASPDTAFDVNYAYRHLATTYNMDRIINPAGIKMFNINTVSSVPDINIVRNTLRAALDPNIYDANQIAVNLIDYLDVDSNVTFFQDTDNGKNYYGFETPCIYISEIAENFYQPDSNNPNNIFRSFAIELFKPYWEDDEPNGWQIVTTDKEFGGAVYTAPISWSGSRRFHVLTNIDPQAPISVNFNELPGPNSFPEPNRVPQEFADINFGSNTTIYLQRNVNGFWLTVDWVTVPDADANGWLKPNTVGDATHSFERDITPHRCIRKVWSPTMSPSPTLGGMNNFTTGGALIQAHPANKPFTNIGEIGQLFRTDAYITGPNNTEADVRLNLAEPNLQNLFNYLTVMDPTLHTIDPCGIETRIKGRVNINTAPWFVLAQLPWLSYHTPNYDLARSIVAYRDKTTGPDGFDYSGRSGPYGFRNIGELMNVSIDTNILGRMGYYIGNGSAIPTTLMTPTDGVGDALEERDVIFDRISNLVTVRSDVFTAYILVRIGADGPQKRVIAIFDRSGVTPTAGGYTGKVKVIAIQQVPDPR
ncbi:MAG: hypothetical protein ABSG97_05605 [Sedimentisphaerales bacterium]